MSSLSVSLAAYLLSANFAEGGILCLFTIDVSCYDDDELNEWRSPSGNNMVFQAIQNGDLSTFRYLLGRIGDKFIHPLSRMTSIQYIFVRLSDGHLDESVATEMVRALIDFNIQNQSRGGEYLDEKYPDILTDLIAHEMFDILRDIINNRILDLGVYINSNGYTVFTYCMELLHYGLLRELLKLYPDAIDSLDEHNRNCLAIAASVGNSDGCNWLLNRGANLYIRNGHDFGILEYILWYMSEFDVDITDEDNLRRYNRTLEVFLSHPNFEMYPHNERVLNQALGVGWVDLILELLDPKYDHFSIPTHDKYGQSILTQAFQHRHMTQECIRKIMDKHPQLVDEINLGSTSLHRVAESGFLDIVKEILEKGLPTANIHARDSLGRFPFQVSQDVEMLIHFIRAGSPMYGHNLTKCENSPSTDNIGRNVFHMACSSGNLPLVKYCVLNHGIDISIQDNFGHDARWHVLNQYIDRRGTFVPHLMTPGRQLILQFLDTPRQFIV